MVDCKYYEEMIIDKKAIKQSFIEKFGNEYDIFCGAGKDPYIITPEDIIKPSAETYGQLLCCLSNKFLTTTKICNDIANKRYYNSLYLLALIDQALTPTNLDKLESSPLIKTIRAKLQEF